MNDMKFADIWSVLSTIDCSKHTEKKVGGKDKFGNTVKLTYLSWTWAWSITMKHFPFATYEVREWDGKPYLNDPLLGIIVMTTVNIGGNERKMWLPVMDGRNNAMKDQAYAIKGYGDKTTPVAQASMMDVNKAIMRCLVKNLAMFGLGINIYAGEDLPVGEIEDTTKAEAPAKPVAVPVDNPAKPAVVESPRKQALPEAKLAWAEYNKLEFVKNMSKEGRAADWKKMIKMVTKCDNAADVTAEGWKAVIATIQPLKKGGQA